VPCWEIKNCSNSTVPCLGHMTMFWATLPCSRCIATFHTSWLLGHISTSGCIAKQNNLSQLIHRLIADFLQNSGPVMPKNIMLQGWKKGMKGGESAHAQVYITLAPIPGKNQKSKTINLEAAPALQYCQVGVLCPETNPQVALPHKATHPSQCPFCSHQPPSMTHTQNSKKHSRCRWLMALGLQNFVL